MKIKLVILVLILLFIISCENKQEVKQVIRPVRYQTVFFSGGEFKRRFTGTSKAGEETKLSFRVSGVLEKMYIIVGQRVKKGFLIAQIDDADARLILGQAEAEAKNAEVQLESAKSNLQRIKELYENNSVSLAEYERAKSIYASSKAHSKTARNSTNLKKRELSYYKLFAPYDGIIASVLSRENENIPAGKIIAILNSQDDIQINVGIPESYISRIKKNQLVKIVFSSLNEQIFDGFVSEISYTLGNNSTYPVSVKLTLPTKEIRPGMSADVFFNFNTSATKESSTVIIAPIQAVLKDIDGNFVLKLIKKEDNLAEVKKTKVTLGNLTESGFEVFEGLKQGDMVVTAGVEDLKDGTVVKLLQE